MNCPSCGWPLKVKHEWESHNFACAIWRCDSCMCDIVAKTPISLFVGVWEKPKNTPETETSIREIINEILEESRPSALKAAIEDVLKDD